MYDDNRSRSSEREADADARRPYIQSRDGPPSDDYYHRSAEAGNREQSRSSQNPPHQDQQRRFDYSEETSGFPHSQYSEMARGTHRGRQDRGGDRGRGWGGGGRSGYNGRPRNSSHGREDTRQNPDYTGTAGDSFRDQRPYPEQSAQLAPNRENDMSNDFTRNRNAYSDSNAQRVGNDYGRMNNRFTHGIEDFRQSSSRESASMYDDPPRDQRSHQGDYAAQSSYDNNRMDYNSTHDQRSYHESGYGHGEQEHIRMNHIPARELSPYRGGRHLQDDQRDSHVNDGRFQGESRDNGERFSRNGDPQLYNNFDTTMPNSLNDDARGRNDQRYRDQDSQYRSSRNFDDPRNRYAGRSRPPYDPSNDKASRRSRSPYGRRPHEERNYRSRPAHEPFHGDEDLASDRTREAGYPGSSTNLQENFGANSTTDEHVASNQPRNAQSAEASETSKSGVEEPVKPKKTKKKVASVPSVQMHSLFGRWKEKGDELRISKPSKDADSEVDPAAALASAQTTADGNSHNASLDGRDETLTGAAPRNPADPAHVTVSFLDSTTRKCLLCYKKFKTVEILYKHEAVESHQTALKNEEMVKLAQARVAALPSVASVAPAPDTAAAAATADSGPDNAAGPEYRDRAQARREAHSQPSKPALHPRAPRPDAERVSFSMKKAAAAPAVAVPSKGAAMLAKQGWTAGSGLGAKGEGRTEAIATHAYQAGAGLGAEGANLGDAADLAARQTTGTWGDYVNTVQDKARERLKKMQEEGK